MGSEGTKMASKDGRNIPINMGQYAAYAFFGTVLADKTDTHGFRDRPRRLELRREHRKRGADRDVGFEAQGCSEHKMRRDAE
jgi:hypothetical protein